MWGGKKESERDGERRETQSLVVLIVVEYGSRFALHSCQLAVNEATALHAATVDELQLLQDRTQLLSAPTTLQVHAAGTTSPPQCAPEDCASLERSLRQRSHTCELSVFREEEKRSRHSCSLVSNHSAKQCVATG